MEPEPSPQDKADARNRALRTLLQGGVALIVLAVAPVVLSLIAGSEQLSTIDWSDVADRAGYAALVAVLMAGLAWAQRRRGL